MFMKQKKRNKNTGLMQGLYYGLIPHTFCILFIIASVLGATFFTTLLRPLMLSTNFFYGLIILSLVFATISAVFYLKKNNLLSLKGVVFKRGYLGLMYSITIFVNLLFFLVIFPAFSNVGSGGIPETYDQSVVLKVDIPCSGHAPLIINELNAAGVFGKYLGFDMADGFEVYYDSDTHTTLDILELEIFQYFSAEIVS